MIGSQLPGNFNAILSDHTQVHSECLHLQYFLLQRKLSVHLDYLFYEVI